MVHYKCINFCICFPLQPITFAFVYVGTTLKDLSDVTHGWNEVSATRLVWLFSIIQFNGVDSVFNYTCFTEYLLFISV